MRNRLPTAIGVVLLQAGCGPSGDGLGSTAPPADYAVLSARADGLRADLGAMPLTVPSTLPFSGTAGYSGVVIMELVQASGSLSIAGAAAATVNFATGTLDGTAQDFQDQADTRYSGTLAITNGFIDRNADLASDPTFYADMSGQLSKPGETYTINASIYGDFHGLSAVGLSATLSGLATTNSGSAALTGHLLAAQ